MIYVVLIFIALYIVTGITSNIMHILEYMEKKSKEEDKYEAYKKKLNG